MPDLQPDLQKAENYEIQFAPGAVELRQRENSTEIELEGYAVHWDKWFDAGRGFQERFMKGAFTEALKKGDQVLALAHQPGAGIARRSKGTMNIYEDDNGLKMEAVIDTDDNDAQSAYVKIRRGDIEGLSVGIIVYGEGGVQQWHEDENGNEFRTIIKVAELLEISLTSIPAYPDSTVALRSRDEWKHNRNYPAIARTRMAMRHRELQSTA